jgi:tRNA nucleotidyltransferase (CCA-adding enzyme)
MFAVLADRIDLADPELSLRLALVYGCFAPDRATKAIEKLGHSNDMKRKLQYAAGREYRLDEIRDKRVLKILLNTVGSEDFRYLMAVSEQQCRVFWQDDSALRRVWSLYEEVLRLGEPIFIGDLAVDGNDLIGAGIGEGLEIGRILKLLLEVVHAEPEKNQRDTLLEIAAENHKRRK